jgi:hypothetical protein
LIATKRSCAWDSPSECDRLPALRTAQAPRRACSTVKTRNSASQVRCFLEAGINYFLCRGAFGDLSLVESLRSVEPFTREVMPTIAAAREAVE